MVTSKKPKQGSSKALSERLKEDRISQLPDSLICQILSHLETKDSVKTSVLSTRWKTLWLWVPSLELNADDPSFGDFPDYDAFVTFGDKFFDSSRVSCIDKIMLRINEITEDLGDAPYFTSWIDAAIKRKVQHLDAFCPPDALTCKAPMSLYTSETLVVLKLHEVVLPNAEFVSLPCLKTLHLKYIWYPNAATFEKLVSCCPVLEDLKISGCGIDHSVMRVHSLSLKSLKMKLHDNKHGVVIDAPLLHCLKIHDTESESYIINNMGSNAKLDVYLTFDLSYFDEARVSSRRSNIRSFLAGISKVRDMTIYTDTFEIIGQYSKLEPLPQFGYMYLLYADIHVASMKWLLPFLGSCPNLKSLILLWEGDMEEMNPMSFSYVPKCVVSSLEYVSIMTRVSGYDAEMKLVRYFLENSEILEKLTLHLDYYRNVNAIFKTLLKIPRRSSTCQVVVG